MQNLKKVNCEMSEKSVQYIIYYTDKQPTCDVKDRFESHAEVAHFERIILLNALAEHAYSFPIIVVKQAVIVGVQSRSLINTR